MWNLTVVESSIADVFVYAEDYAGNSDSILVTGIEVVDLLLFGDGFQYRGPAPEENDQVSIEQDLDEIPPQILEFFNNYPNPYIVVSSDPEETPAQYLLSNQPKTSAIIFRPKLEKLFLTTDIPELCWELMGGDVSKYQVKLSTEGEVIISNWSQSTCWQPRTSLRSHAIFEWQIRVKNADGIESPWSNMGRFVVIQDQLEHESGVRKSLADSADSKKSKR